MKILEYDAVDPLRILDLNLLCFRFALTPEKAGQIRRLDARAFPFLAIYAVDEGLVLGQTGVFRLPAMTVNGPEEVGGIWAMCTHPAYSRRGIGSLLIAEAHARMRAAGLRFVALGTSRHWVAHPFYQRHGYQDIACLAEAFAPRTAVKGRDNGLYATKATHHTLPAADALFRHIAAGKTGFSRRHHDFLSKMVAIGDDIRLEDLRLLYYGHDLIGYAAVQNSETVFKVNDILLLDKVDIVAAVTGLLAESEAPYIQITLNNHAPQLAHLQQAGFQVTFNTLDVVMLKPLVNSVETANVPSLFGIDTNRFMMSWMDVT